MPTSKSCATTAAINKTSRSTIRESFRDYRYSCADAKSRSACACQRGELRTPPRGLRFDLIASASSVVERYSKR
jgi:hypothetical protein